MFVQVHKADRIRKAARRAKPEWQDTVPPDEELRDTYAIARRHEDRFSRAFTDAARSILDDPVVLQNIRASLRDGDQDGAINSVPWYKPGDENSEKLWRRLSQKLFTAYGDVIQETGKYEFDRINRRFKTNLKFSLKQKKEVPVVPVNPWSIKWIDQQAFRLIDDMSKAMQRTMRQIVSRGFERGLRADAIMSELLKPGRLGLLDREERAVMNRLSLLLGQGVPEDKAIKNADRYAIRLLRNRAMRIARTETIMAQAAGRNQAWEMAKDAGQLPAVERVWVAATASPRLCEICDQLDGETADIGEPYMSAFIGPVMHPVAHPHCRCSEILRRKRG